MPDHSLLIGRVRRLRRTVVPALSCALATTGAQLDVNPADLLRAADTYTGLAERISQLSPRAAAEVARVADTHGPIGCPTAVGIAAGIANAEPPLHARVIDFQSYSQRFADHAATYTTEDHDAPNNPTTRRGSRLLGGARRARASGVSRK